jgi:HEPN domain-containing protein
MSDHHNKIIKSWIEKADHDLGSAKIIFQHLPDYFDTIAFHCQQAVEKYIKACLVNLNIDFKRSHDLLYLLELLSGQTDVTTETFDKAIQLNEYSVEIRYPNQIIFLSNEELKSAISIADEFREICFGILGLKD